MNPYESYVVDYLIKTILVAMAAIVIGVGVMMESINKRKLFNLKSSKHDIANAVSDSSMFFAMSALLVYIAHDYLTKNLESLPLIIGCMFLSFMFATTGISFLITFISDKWHIDRSKIRLP